VRYEQLKDRKPAEFQRLTGVHPTIFESMVNCLPETIGQRGRPCRLSAQDQLLLTLMYWREYRSQAHIALSYGVSEPTVCRIIRKVEKHLLASGEFTLPGKKALQKPDLAFEVVIVDATEVPVQRPKKTKTAL